ncbi:hypothetical protein ACFX5K_06205 [Rickettsiales bacterium LUAb2]
MEDTTKSITLREFFIVLCNSLKIKTVIYNNINTLQINITREALDTNWKVLNSYYTAEKLIEILGFKKINIINNLIYQYELQQVVEVQVYNKDYLPHLNIHYPDLFSLLYQFYNTVHPDYRNNILLELKQKCPNFR